MQYIQGVLLPDQQTLRGDADMNINIIKQETMVRKRLLQEPGGINVQGPKFQTMIKNGKKEENIYDGDDLHANRNKIGLSVQRL